MQKKKERKMGGQKKKKEETQCERGHQESKQKKNKKQKTKQIKRSLPSSPFSFVLSFKEEIKSKNTNYYNCFLKNR